jgi:DNA gyrase subunit A
VPADQVRITARQTMGVTLFRLSEDESVTSVFPVLEDAAATDENGGDAEDSAGPDNG